MIQPQVSGVALTINPVTGQSDEIVISATWGLGEALVSGQVEPDEFRVNKRDGIVCFTHLGEKRYRVIADQGISHFLETDPEERDRPTLSEVQLCELAGLLAQIEREYDAPQDVEWCHDGQQFWLVQTRPVTAAAPPPVPISSGPVPICAKSSPTCRRPRWSISYAIC